MHAIPPTFIRAFSREFGMPPPPVSMISRRVDLARRRWLLGRACQREMWPPPRVFMHQPHLIRHFKRHLWDTGRPGQYARSAETQLRAR